AAWGDTHGPIRRGYRASRADREDPCLIQTVLANPERTGCAESDSPGIHHIRVNDLGVLGRVVGQQVGLLVGGYRLLGPGFREIMGAGVRSRREHGPLLERLHGWSPLAMPPGRRGPLKPSPQITKGMSHRVPPSRMEPSPRERERTGIRISSWKTRTASARWHLPALVSCDGDLSYRGHARVSDGHRLGKPNRHILLKRVVLPSCSGT